MKPTPVPTTS